MPSILANIADRLILCPTTDPIVVENSRRELIDGPSGTIEAWVSLNNSQENTALIHSTPIQLLAIKFPGTAGRAERSGPHPFEIWPNRPTEIWTVNHAGYGGSAGPASLKNFATTCDTVWRHLSARYPKIPIAVVGNSLGCVSALYLAARQNVAGLYLRNAVALEQMLATRPRYNWWNFGLAARLISKQIPAELCSVENARNSRCSALFIRSECDRVSPEKYQRMIFDAYAGEKSEFVIAGAQHDEWVGESQREEYLEFLQQNQSWI